MSESLFFFVLILGLIPFIITLFLKRKYEVQTFPIIPFLGLVFFSSITEFVLYSFKMETNYWGRIYTFLDFLAVFYYFKQVLKPKHRYFFSFSFVLFLLLYIYLLFIWNVTDSIKTESYLTIFETTFVLSAAVLWFKFIFEETKETSLLLTPDYYFISGFVLYFSGTFFLFLVSDFILKNMTASFLSFWNLNIYLGIILRLLLISGIWISRKK